MYIQEELLPAGKPASVLVIAVGPSRSGPVFCLRSRLGVTYWAEEAAHHY